MLENILYALTQISLLCSAIAIVFDSLFSGIEQKHGLKIAKIGVLLSAGFNILFYNKSFYPPFFEMSAYSTFAYCIMCLASYSILIRSFKWSSENTSFSSNAFAFLLICLLCCYSLFVTTTYWLMLLSVSALILFLQYMLLRLSSKSEELYHLSRKYGITALLIFLFIGAVLGYMAWNHFSYLTDLNLLTNHTARLLIAISLLMIFMFLMGIAPFHFALADCIAHTSLPIATYFHLVPIFGVAATFLKYQDLLLVLCPNHLSDIYLTFGIISVIIAVIGIHSTRFLKQILASVHLYVVGVWFIFLFFADQASLTQSLIYLMGYLIAALGTDTCLYYFKSASQDIDHLNSLNGLFEVRPYLTSAFILFILSLSGLPPFLGFVTELSVLKTMAALPYVVCFVVTSMLLMWPAYLKIIYTVSFLSKEHTFDRVDFSTYVWLLFYGCLIVFLMIHPTVFFEIAHLV